MKKLLSLLTIATFTNAEIAFSQINLHSATPQQAAATIEGGNVFISVNSSFVNNAATQLKLFNTGTAAVNIEEGIVLSTANLGTNPNSLSPAQILVGAGTPGTNLFSLSGITTAITNNAAVLTIEIIPLYDTLQFTYVFASNEYNTFVNSSFNDVFGFFVTGPNPLGGDYQLKNIAIIPGTTDVPVSINTVNNGTSCPPAGPCSNCQFFINNCNGASVPFALRGLTIPMTAKVAVIPLQSYTIQMAVADVADGSLNSVVLLQGESLFSFGNGPTTGLNNNNVIDIQACGSYTLMGDTIYQSGTYYHNIYHLDGTYDSLTLNINIIPNDVTYITETACGSFTFNNQTYTQSGLHPIYTSNGICEALTVLNLTILPQSDTLFITETTCGNFNFFDQILTQSGVYHQNFQNQYGCDSTVTLNLTITQFNAEVVAGNSSIIALNQQADSYIWEDCNTGEILQGFNSFELIAPYSGSFRLIMEYNGCFYESICYNLTALSLNQNDEIETLKIYPNPIKDFIRIETPFEIKEVQIIDINGKNLLTKNVNKSGTVLLEANLQNGIYFIKIIDSKNFSSINKIIVNRD